MQPGCLAVSPAGDALSPSQGEPDCSAELQTLRQAWWWQFSTLWLGLNSGTVIQFAPWVLGGETEPPVNPPCPDPCSGMHRAVGVSVLPTRLFGMKTLPLLVAKELSKDCPL